VLSEVLAYNLQAQFGAFRPLQDSDGEGLTDVQEREFDMDPSLADTDGDGVRDGIEAFYPTSSSPCPDPSSDRDLDGLRDCEEIIIGTNPDNPDTDGDFLLDRIEWSLRGIPMISDDFLDSDDDGFDNRQEVLAHLQPETPNSQEEWNLWAYKYASRPSNTGTAEQPCYVLEVENIGIAPTRQADDRTAGVNLIELFAVFRPEDSLGNTVFKRAVAESRIVSQTERIPSSDRIELVDEDFVLMTRE
ncbi:MAG: hypothetical protein AAFY60_18320, partial [Myxococcota bacterium]